MGRSRRVDSRVFNGGPWLTHVDGSPSSALSPSRPLCLLGFPPVSNRGRGCTMQELRVLSFGPQKYATPGTDFLRDAHVRPDRTCLHRRLQRPGWMRLPSYMPYKNGPGSKVYWHIVKNERVLHNGSHGWGKTFFFSLSRRVSLGRGMVDGPLRAHHLEMRPQRSDTYEIDDTIVLRQRWYRYARRQQ